MNKFTQRLESIPVTKCKCFIPPLHYTDYQKSHIGIDETNGRFAEVTLQTCIHCGTRWLSYTNYKLILIQFCGLDFFCYFWTKL
jgi:hypothetical protein